MVAEPSLFPRTIRARTTLAASAIVGLALVMGAFSLLAVLRRSLLDNLDTIAETSARDVVAQAEQDSLPATLVLPGSETAVIQVVDSSGRVISSSGNLQGEPPIATLHPSAGGRASIDLKGLPIGEGGTFRVVAVADSRARFTVYAAVDIDSVATTVDTARGLLLVGLPVLLALESAVTWLIVGRALRPVEAIRAEVAEISAQDLSLRVPEPGTKDEIGRLAGTMNEMLGRIERSVDQQRRFVADASHELQSPIAASRAELEVGLAHPEHLDWPVTATRVLAENERMERLVGDLLFLARNDDPAVPRPSRPIDLDDVVNEEVDRFRALTTKTISATPLQPALVRGRPEDLARVMRNLLDNAARYARSRIDVRLTTDSDSAVLEVIDDGPGIPEAERSRVFDRFVRMDDARSRSSGGTGLGLAIVHDAVTAHGGTVGLDDGAGGAHFVIRIPLAD